MKITKRNWTDNFTDDLKEIKKIIMDRYVKDW